MHQIFSVRLGFWCYFVRLYQKMGQEIAISSQENYLLMISQWYQKWQNLDIKKPQIPATFRNISKHVFQNPVNFNSPLFYRLNYARITDPILYLKSAQVKDFLNILQGLIFCDFCLLVIRANMTIYEKNIKNNSENIRVNNTVCTRSQTYCFCPKFRHNLGAFYESYIWRFCMPMYKKCKRHTD